MRLNAPGKYEVFPQNGTAKNTEQMPLLIKSGRVPVSMADVMRERVKLRFSDDKVLKANWNNNYVDTGDGALYAPEGATSDNLVVAYDAEALRELNPKSKLTSDRALDMSGVNLKNITGERFTKEQLEKMVLGQRLTLKQAKEHPIWQALARGNSRKLADYAEMIFEEGEYYTAMTVFLDSPSDTPKMRAWFVDGADYGSGAVGDDGLVSDYGRLVGLASEMQGSK